MEKRCVGISTLCGCEWATLGNGFFGCKYEGDCEHQRPRQSVVKKDAEIELLKEGIVQALEIISEGAKIMTLDQLSGWEGCRGIIERWDICKPTGGE